MIHLTHPGPGRQRYSAPIMDGYWLDWKQRTNADDADLYVRARDMLCYAMPCFGCGAGQLMNKDKSRSWTAKHFLHARQWLAKRKSSSSSTYMHGTATPPT